jgi:hypothetical protein
MIKSGTRYSCFNPKYGCFWMGLFVEIVRALGGEEALPVGGWKFSDETGRGNLGSSKDVEYY